jgi:hypothetical protein
MRNKITMVPFLGDLAEKRKKRRFLNQSRPLTGNFEDYLTDVIPTDYQEELDRPHDTEWWEAINKDMESGKPPF